MLYVDSGGLKPSQYQYRRVARRTVGVMPLAEVREVGCHVGECHTQRGYATDVVKAYLPVPMGRLVPGEVLGTCHSGNAASRRVLEKCGFSLEFDGMGIFRGEMQHVCRFKLHAQPER